MHHGKPGNNMLSLQDIFNIMKVQMWTNSETASSKRKSPESKCPKSSSDQ